MKEMKNERRGFITTAAGTGLFMTGMSVGSRAFAAGIGSEDMLIAMPGGRFYALPNAVMDRHQVSENEFSAEEDRRAGGISKSCPPPP